MLDFIGLGPPKAFALYKLDYCFYNKLVFIWNGNLRNPTVLNGDLFGVE